MRVKMQMPLRHEPDPDLSLVQAAARGDADALGRLMRRNERWVRAVVYGVLGDADRLDDVCQQVWLSVWQHAGRLADVRSWRPWLYRLARNAALDETRRRASRRRSWRELAERVARRLGRAGPAEAAIRKQEHQRVLAALRELPDVYREPFVLRHVEGLSYAEIAELLGAPVDTVGTRLVRARRMLRERLSRGGEP